MTKQDEKQRMKQRLQEYAIELATRNRWEEAIEANQHILLIEEDPATYNRLGKAYLQQGLYQQGQEAFQNALQLNPINTIAKKNLARIEALLARGIEEGEGVRHERSVVDSRLFITEAGRTATTTLFDVPRSLAIETLASGEKVELVDNERELQVVDGDGNFLGNIEPKLGQRLRELMKGGNRYLSAVIQCDTRQIRILIREIFQSPGQRGRVSFPVKLSEVALGYTADMRYDYEVEELLEEEEITIETEESEPDFSTPDEDEEIGLDDIEKDIPDEDDAEE